MRFKNIDWDQWKNVPDGYAQAFISMLGGGVKESTDDRYMTNFKEYWRTMRRLKVSDEEVWTFPTKSFVIQLYIVDCAKMREKVNTWDTIRYKLRAIDYVAQLCGVFMFGG